MVKSTQKTAGQHFTVSEEEFNVACKQMREVTLHVGHTEAEIAGTIRNICPPNGEFLHVIFQSHMGNYWRLVINTNLDGGSRFSGVFHGPYKTYVEQLDGVPIRTE